MKIKFFISPYIKPERANYQHNIVVLAEGFKELGITFYGNIDYWMLPESSTYLIERNDGDHYDVAIYSSNYVLNNQEVCENLKNGNSSLHVLIDSMDGYETLALTHAHYFDLVLRTHFNKYIPYPYNVKPWIFGLSNRIVNAIDNSRDLQPLPRFFINYRVTHNVRSQAVEKVMNLSFNKYKVFHQISTHLDKPNVRSSDLYYQQTGRRHDNRYYELLNKSMFTLAFGGEEKLKPHKVSTKYDRFKRKMYLLNNALINRGVKLLKSNIVYQFDSWRLWESFYSNSIPITLEFKVFGHVLPIEPKSYDQYIGIKDISSSKEWNKINSISKQELENISKNGTNWVLSNYTPKPTANLFFSII